MHSPGAVAGYRRAMQPPPIGRGQWVLIRRISGNDANSTRLDSRVLAIVTSYVAKPPIGGTVGQEGAITLGARTVIVLADDLRTAHAPFPLPVQKNDKVVTNLDADRLGDGVGFGDEELNIMSVDPNTRHIAGAIELVAEGV